MKTTSQQLLSATDYGNAAGNYDGTTGDFNGDAVKAAGYYSTHGTLQSVAFFTEDFLGTIEIQATVDSDSATAEWFTVHTFDGDGSSANDSSAQYWNEVQNITGRFTWVRAKVTGFTQGVINKVIVSY